MPKMHADEIEIDAALVHHLIAAQFPQWADLPITRVESSGTDNAMFRLGSDMALRLPRIAAATAQVEKEQRWLPELAPHLPLTIPAPLALGEPDAAYPLKWSIYRWLDGDNAINTPPRDQHEAARALADFITVLQRIDPAGGPLHGAHNFNRGEPLAVRDAATRQAIAQIANMIDFDARAALAAWEAALSAPAWDGQPRWIHGDLMPGNLLVFDGQISAVIDFGGLGVGDPACDLLIAWNFFTAEARATFRAALGVDAATWARGRGWALTVGLVAIPYYLHTNPTLAGIGQRTVAAILADQA